MFEFRYQFESYVLTKKILKVAKKMGLKPLFKEGFEFSDYYIDLDEFEGQKVMSVETLDGNFYRVPITKRLKSDWNWPDASQVPSKETIRILKELYAFLKA